MWLSLLFFIALTCVTIKVEGATQVKKPPKIVTQSPQTDAPKHEPVVHNRNEITTTKSSGDNQEDDEDSHALNQLLEVIFSKYHKELVPVRPTTIKLDLLLLKVKSTIEKEGIFETVIALFMEWQDKRMRWNPRDYENVTILAFDSDKVWLPDIAMTNSADHLYSISKDTRFVVRVTYDGAMKFVPTGTARTWCDLKLLTFPFDIQTCSFEFESWSLDSSTMTFNDSSEALVDDSFSSPQWELCQRHAVVYQHVYNFTGEIFTRVRFDFVVRRKSTFYIINLIFPCSTLSLIQLLVFLIPSTDSTSDRVGFGTTNLLTLVVFQTIVTAEMPKSSDAVTALSKYIIALIIISAVGIFESVIAERLLRTTTTPPPKWSLRLVGIFPLLWGSQLPSGINQMILEGGDCSKEDEQGDQKKGRKEKNKEIHQNGILGNKSLCCRDSTTTAPKITITSDGTKDGHNNEEPLWVPRSPHERLCRSQGGAISKAKRRPSTIRSASSPMIPSTAPHLSARLCNRKRMAIQEQLRQKSHDDDWCGMCLWPNNRSESAIRFGSPTDIDDYIMATLRAFNQPLDKVLETSPPTNATYYPPSALAPFNRTSFADDTYSVSSLVLNPRAMTKQRAASSDSNLAINTEPSDDPDGKQLQHQLTRIQNGILWGELVTKLDHVIFITCTSLAVFIPLLLFVPLIVFDEKCRTSVH